MNVKDSSEMELVDLQKNANRKGSNKGLMKVTDAEFYDLYTRGYNDKRIAGLVGVSTVAIWHRRMVLNLSPNGKVFNKGTEVTDFKNRVDELREKTIEYNSENLKRPVPKKRRKKYNKNYFQRPAVKKRQKEYEQSPEAKLKAKEYNQRPEVKKRLKEYRKKLEVKKKRRIHNKAHYLKNKISSSKERSSD